MICLWCLWYRSCFQLNASQSRLASQSTLFSSRDQQAAVGCLLRMEVILPNTSLLLNTLRQKEKYLGELLQVGGGAAGLSVVLRLVVSIHKVRAKVCVKNMSQSGWARGALHIVRGVWQGIAPSNCLRSYSLTCNVRLLSANIVYMLMIFPLLIP